MVDRIARLRRAVFARHAHPVSAWSRRATTPLLVWPLWSRSRRDVAIAAVWFAVNPIMTPPPADSDSFATQAMLGEERWSSGERRSNAVVAVNALNAACLGAGALGAWRRRPWLAVAGTAASMLVTLVSWRQYAAIYRAAPGTGPDDHLVTDSGERH